MANKTIYVEVPGNQYGECIILDNYKGVWSLVAGRKVKDPNSEHVGKVFKEWAFPQKHHGGEYVPHDTAVPVKIVLGPGKEQALQTMRLLAAHLMPDKQG